MKASSAGAAHREVVRVPNGGLLPVRGRAARLRTRLFRRRDDPGPARPHRLTFYPADLARIHDEGFGDFARAAAAELLTRLPRSGLVVELGCGSGISTQILTNAGHEVVGIDISRPMLAIARERAPRATLRHGSIWDAELPPCAAITAIGEVLNYAADPHAGADRLPDLFASVSEALHPGGLFMFDFATPGRGTLRSGGPTRVDGDDWRISSEASEDPVTQTLERRMEIEMRGERRVEVHTLNLYERDFVLNCLVDTGFTAEPLNGYSGVGFWPGYAAFAA